VDVVVTWFLCFFSLFLTFPTFPWFACCVMLTQRSIRVHFLTQSIARRIDDPVPTSTNVHHHRHHHRRMHRDTQLHSTQTTTQRHALRLFRLFSPVLCVARVGLAADLHVHLNTVVNVWVLLCATYGVFEITIHWTILKCPLRQWLNTTSISRFLQNNNIARHLPPIFMCNWNFSIPQIQWNSSTKTNDYHGHRPNSRHKDLSSSLTPSPTTAVCRPACQQDNGVCVDGACRCKAGWTGEACDVKKCDIKCSEHGSCVNGVCQCDLGWNGRTCSFSEFFVILSFIFHCRYFVRFWCIVLVVFYDFFGMKV